MYTTNVVFGVTAELVWVRMKAGRCLLAGIWARGLALNKGPIADTLGEKSSMRLVIKPALGIDNITKTPRP